MAELNVQRTHVPNSLLEAAKDSLGLSFQILPKRIQLGYLAMFLGNRYITEANQHKTFADSFKIGKAELGKLFGDYRRFRSVNHNGFYMKPRKTKSKTDQGLLSLCKSEDVGAVYYEPLELVVQTYKGHNAESEKGLLSAYQLTDRVQLLMDNWIDNPIVVGKDLRYMQTLKGHKVDLNDNSSVGILRTKSATPHNINISQNVEVSLPGMLMYKILLQLVRDYVYRYGEIEITKNSKGMKIVKKDKVLKKYSRLWNEIATQLIDGDKTNEDVYWEMAVDVEPSKEPTMEEVKILKEKILERMANFTGGGLRLGEGSSSGSSLVEEKVNKHTSKPIKTLLEDDLSLLNINIQLQELEDLIFTLRETGVWKIPVIYEECGTGRYFTSILQGYCKEVRYAALKGYYAYDIEAAHQNLLVQLMDKKGIDFPELDIIRGYVNFKKKTRSRLAKKLMISVSDVKGILQVLTYGSRLSLNKREALYECCNENDNTVKRVKSHPWVTTYKSAFDIAIDKITLDTKDLTNAVGILIENEKTKKSQKMAHILQGLEVYVLNAIIKRSEFGDIKLLLHDCVVFDGRVDSKEISRVVLEETGFKLLFDEELY